MDTTLIQPNAPLSDPCQRIIKLFGGQISELFATQAPNVALVEKTLSQLANALTTANYCHHDNLHQNPAVQKITFEAASLCGYLEKSVGAGEIDLHHSAYCQEILRISRHEGSLAQVNKKSHVYLIGCGSVPITALCLAQEHGCEVTCLDNDAKCLIEAERFLGRQPLGRFHFALPDEIDDWAQYSHIYLTGLVPEKETELEKIAAKVSPGSRVVVRHGSGLKVLFTFPLPKIDERVWKIDHVLAPPNHFFDTTFLQRVE